MSPWYRFSIGVFGCLYGFTTFCWQLLLGKKYEALNVRAKALVMSFVTEATQLGVQEKQASRPCHLQNFKVKPALTGI